MGSCPILKFQDRRADLRSPLTVEIQIHTPQIRSTFLKIGVTNKTLNL